VIGWVCWVRGFSQECVVSAWAALAVMGMVARHGHDWEVWAGWRWRARVRLRVAPAVGLWFDFRLTFLYRRVTGSDISNVDFSNSFHYRYCSDK